MRLHTHVALVVAFNTKAQVLFECTSAPPEGVTPVVYFLDVSGSIASHADELRAVAGAFLANSNAEGRIGQLRPNGGTAMVKALLKYQHLLGRCDVVIVTDGYENEYDGTLPVSNTEWIDLSSINKRSPEYLTGVANWLAHVCGCQIYFLGLGNNASEMASVMLRRRNVFVSTIPRGAARSDAASVVGTVQALRIRARAALPPPAAEGAAAPPTEEGEAAPPVQDVVILPTSEEARAAIAALSPADIEAATAVGQQLQIVDTNNKQDEVPTTAAQAKAVILEAMAVAATKVTLTGDALQHTLKLAIWYMQQSREINNGNGLPSTIVSGKSFSNAGLFEFAAPEASKYLNTLFSAINNIKRQNVLNKIGTVEKPSKLEVEGVSRSYSVGTTLYRADLTTAVLDELAADTELCGTAKLLKRCTCAKSSGAAASLPAARRQRTSPSTSPGAASSSGAAAATDAPPTAADA